MNGNLNMDTIMPSDPNQVMIHNAAMTARARRKHHSTPRIRHWLEDVMEQSRLSTPFIFDENDEPMLSPTHALGLKDNGIFSLGPQRTSMIQIHLPSQFSNSSVSLQHKESCERLDSSDSDSGPTFSDCEPTSPVVSPAPQSRKARSRPNLTIKTSTRYRTNYTIARDQAASLSPVAPPKTQLPPAPQPSPLTTPTIAGFPYFAPVAPFTQSKANDSTPSLAHNPAPGALTFNFPIPPARKATAAPTQLPIFVKTSHGVEELTLPRMESADRKHLRRVKTRMEKKSARMLEVAMRERGRTADYLGGNGAQVRRRVLMEAVGKVTDEVLGFERCGVVKRNW